MRDSSSEVVDIAQYIYIKSKMHQTRTRSDSLQFQRLTRQVGKVLELSHFICGNKRVKRRSSFAAIPIPPNSRKGSTFTPPVVSRRNSTPATPVLSSGDSKTDTTAPSDGDTMTYYEYGVSNMRIGLPAVEEQSQVSMLSGFDMQDQLCFYLRLVKNNLLL